MILVRKIKISNKYKNLISCLLKQKQHLKNLLILAYENSTDKEFKKHILNFMSIRSLLAETNNEGSLIIEKDLDEEKLIQLLSYNKFNNKIIVDIVKELKVSYDVSFKLLKRGFIKHFKMSTKKLSKVKSGTLEINSNSVRYKDKTIKFTINSKKHNEPLNGLSIYVGNYFEDKTLEIKNVKLQLEANECYLLITYSKEEKCLSNKNNTGYIGIDPGLNNHFSIVNNNGFKSILIRNSTINRINYSSSKILDKINKEKDILINKQDFKSKFKKLKERSSYIHHKRMIIIDQELHKIANRIIDYCKITNSKYIILGYNKDQKSSVDMGKDNNRKFYNVPHQKLTSILKYLTSLNNIELILQEESYTSKLSSINDEVWKYKYGKNKPKEAKGLRGFKKITSLYKENSLIYHADINGAFNIIQKFIKGYVDKTKYQLCNPIIVKNDFMFLKELNKI